MSGCTFDGHPRPADDRSEAEVTVVRKLATAVATPTRKQMNIPQTSQAIMLTPFVTPEVTMTAESFPLTMTRQLDDMVMLFVPAGTFMIGSDPDSGIYVQANEIPQHAVTLTEYWIDRHEVTREQFVRFLNNSEIMEFEEAISWLLFYSVIEEEDGRYQPNSSSSPINYISWDMANAYCLWAGGEQVYSRLPTEAQWEYAARGDSNAFYPWGNDEPTCELVQFEDCYGAGKPVGSFSPQGDSWVGAQDMAGNLWEWVADWYSEGYYQTSPARDPLGPASGVYKVIRGGGHDSGRWHIRASLRYVKNFSDAGSFNVGFRCASTLTQNSGR